MKRKREIIHVPPHTAQPAPRANPKRHTAQPAPRGVFCEGVEHCTLPAGHTAPHRVAVPAPGPVLAVTAAAPKKK